MEKARNKSGGGALPGTMGWVVFKRRKALGLTQTKLAQLSGAGQSYISIIETGGRPPRIGAAKIFGLAKALQLKAEPLKRGVEEPASANDTGAAQFLDANLSVVNHAKWIAYGEGLLAAQSEEEPPKDHSKQLRLPPQSKRKGNGEGARKG